MTDNVTMAVHLVNSASLPHFLSAAAAAADHHHTHRGGPRNARPLSAYSSSTFHRRPNSFESLNSSSSEYEYDWSNMDQIVQDQLHENDIIKRSKLQASPSLEKDVDEEEIDEAVSVTTQQDVEWFKSLGLDAVLARVFEGANQKPDALELAPHFTKSQTDTVRRRLASLQGTISRASSRQIAEVLSRTSSDLDITPLDTHRVNHEAPIKKTIVKQSRDVRDIFKNERRSSSSSDETDTTSPKLHRSTDSVDSATIEQKLSDVFPENYRHSGYCLTQPLEAVTKQRSPPRRWKTPLGGQAAGDIVGQDPETGIKVLKINYFQSGYDTKVQLEQPPPVVWPKSSPGGTGNAQKPAGQDIQLEFAYQLHPSERPNAEWPDVVMRSCPIGIASVDDLLWEADLQSVKQFALIELTQIFDKHQLTQSKRRQKPKKKIKNSPEIAVFGSSLDRLVVLDNNRHGYSVGCGRPSTLDVPVVFQQMLNYLEESGGIGEEGILRLCGETNRMRRLRSELDSYYSRQPLIGQDESSASLDEAQWFRKIFQTVSVHDIASVMKQFLRDLPQPLLTNELVDAFAQISEIPDRITQIQALNLLVLQLPPAERATLKALLRFLRKATEAEKSNKMSSANIALIIAPNIFHPKVKTSSPSSSQNFQLLSSNHNSERRDEATKQFDLVAKLSTITRVMIVYSNFLFATPPSFLQQIRTKHVSDLKLEKKAKEKRISRLDPRKMRKAPKTLPVLPEADKTDSTFFQQQFPVETSSAVIRVRLGRRNSGDGENQKVSTAVQITPGLTAGDVVAKFLPSSSLASSPEISTSTEPLNLSTSSGVSGSDKSSSSSNENLLDIESGRSVNGYSAEKREQEPPVSLHTHFLVEQGGNIGIRRLDHSVSMLAAHHANPTAVWIVKYFAHI